MIILLTTFRDAQKRSSAEGGGGEKKSITAVIREGEGFKGKLQERQQITTLIPYSCAMIPHA